MGEKIGDTDRLYEQSRSSKPVDIPEPRHSLDDAKTDLLEHSTEANLARYYDTCDQAKSEERQSIRVIVPEIPPVLTPGAARALLRLLDDAREKIHADGLQAREGKD
jgi:hypothetical protein